MVGSADRHVRAPRAGRIGCEARAVLVAAKTAAKPEMRWIPWLCAYTGARVNEMAQLTRASFYQVEGRWFMRVTTMGGKSLKNRHSERLCACTS